MMVPVEIKIVKVPVGEAPEEYRQAWVGLTMLAQLRSATQVKLFEIVTRSPATVVAEYVWEVETSEALRALSNAGHTEALKWFKAKSQSSALYFEFEEAEET